MRRIAPMLLLSTGFALTTWADEPRRAEDVFSDAEGERTVVYIAPEGSKVTKGQVVCVLDARPGRAGGADRKAAVARAEAGYRNARLTREVAEIALKEYEQGTFKGELETVDGEVALAESELKRAEERHEWSRRMREKRYLTQAQATSDRLGLERAKAQLEQARSRRAVLLDYTKVKTVKEMKAEVEKARSEELARKAELDALRSGPDPAGARVILAPADGTVRLARPTRLVEPGAEVGKDQLLLRIIPAGD